MHSLGWGFTVSDGVTATLSVADAESTTVRFNDTRIDFPTVVEALSGLANIPFNVDLQSTLPLSSGFGLSGASAYASLLAAESLLRTGHTRSELAMMAHVAEVRNLTGLGDVCSQHIGGCLAKVRPGSPLNADRIDVNPQPIYWRYFSPIRTSEVLANKMRHKLINESADVSLETLAGMMRKSRQIRFSLLADIALGFATSSGLLADPSVKECISEARAAGGSASMIMLGNSVFSTTPFEKCNKTMLSQISAHVI